MASKNLTLKEFRQMGGKARTAKYPKEVRSAWAKKGGDAIKQKDPNHFKKMAEASKIARQKKKESALLIPETGA